MTKIEKIRDATMSLVYTFYNQLDYLKYQVNIHNELVRSEFMNPFEMIICDDGSNDGTNLWYEREHKGFLFPSKYIRLDKRGMRCGLAKNKGIEASDGKYTYISDGDTFCPASSYLHLLHKTNVGEATFGKRLKIDFEKLDKENVIAYEKQLDAVKKSDEDWRGTLKDIPPASYSHFSGANCMFPTEELKKIKWVPDDWTGYGFDDYYCAINWMGVLGGHLTGVNEAIAYHVDHPNTVGDETNRRRLKARIEELRFNITERFGGGVLEGGY